MSAREISRNFSGGPSLVVSSSLVPVGDATLEFGLDTIFARVEGAEVHLIRDVRIARVDDLVEAPQLPGDVLAIVAVAEDASAISALWSDRGLEPPPVIVVENALQALGPILARARADIAAVSSRCADLQHAVASTRMEFEETRSAMQSVMRTLSHRYATKMKLAAAVAPSREKAVTLSAPDVLRKIYPVTAESVTCLALHLAALGETANAVLKVMLLGVESGRVLGEWQRPGEALFAGWNSFDLPTPVAAVRETVAVEVSLDGVPGSALSLSLSDDAAGDEPEPFAIRIWTTDAAGRFPYAEHWVWNAWGTVRPPAGTATVLGRDALRRSEARGPVETMRDPADGHPTGYLLRGGSSLLRIPAVPISGSEAVCIELGYGLGDLRNTRFEFALQTADVGFASGWRSFEYTDHSLKMALSLPSDLPESVDLYLRIEDGERAEDEFATVVLRYVGLVSGTRRPLDLNRRKVRIKPEAVPPFEPRPAISRFARCKAAKYSEGDTFALFEMLLERVEFDGCVKHAVRAKASISKGRFCLEFRRGENWPEIFAVWPGREEDRFGEFFRITDGGGKLEIEGELTTPEDSDLVVALCRLMPVAVASSLRLMPGAAPRLDAWLEAARAFSISARHTLGGLDT